MAYAIRKDNKGWRAVNSPDDVGPDETFSDEQPTLIADSAADTIRAQRVPLFAVADIAINRLEDASADASAWRKYRQALRDVPSQNGFPEKVQWPELPQ